MANPMRELAPGRSRLLPSATKSQRPLGEGLATSCSKLAAFSRPLSDCLRIVLFEDCSAFTRVAACTLALSPICDTLIEGFSHFVTSMTLRLLPAGAVARMGFAPTGKRRLCTAHTLNGH